MNIHPLNKTKNKIVNKLIRITNRLENDDNTDPETNGEKFFISEWRKKYAEIKNVTVFDVGANIGEYVEDLIAADIARADNLHIHAFEPSSAFDALTKKTHELKQGAGEANSARHIFPVHAGLSDSQTDQQMFADKDGSKLSTVHMRDRANYKAVWKPVGIAHFIRADAYIEKEKITHIHLLKIDVEGHELSVLKGFGKYLNPDFVDYIQFEYSEANMDSHTTLFELYDILEKAGFKITKILPKSLEMRPYSRGYEKYHYSNWVALNPKLI